MKLTCDLNLARFNQLGAQWWWWRNSTLPLSPPSFFSLFYFLSFSSSPSFASFLLLLLCYNNNENHHGKIRNFMSLLLSSYITMHTNENNQGAKIVSFSCRHWWQRPTSWELELLAMVVMCVPHYYHKVVVTWERKKNTQKRRYIIIIITTKGLSMTTKALLVRVLWFFLSQLLGAPRGCSSKNPCLSSLHALK
jgi:hypothetical protein